MLPPRESGSEVAYEGNETLGFSARCWPRGSAGMVASASWCRTGDVVPLMGSLHRAVRSGATAGVALHEGTVHSGPGRPAVVRQLVRLQRLRRGLSATAGVSQRSPPPDVRCTVWPSCCWPARQYRATGTMRLAVRAGGFATTRTYATLALVAVEGTDLVVLRGEAPLRIRWPGRARRWPRPRA